MKKEFNRVINSSFFRNVLFVAMGAAGSQAITICFSPILTRIYGPQIFGLLGIFSAIVSVLSPVIALTYPLAIVLPKKDSDAKSLVLLSFFLTLLITLILSVFVLLFGDRFFSLIDFQLTSSSSVLIIVAIFFTSLLQISQQWLIRNKQFRTIAITSLAQSIVVNVFKAILGWFNPAAVILISTTAFAPAIQTFMIWRELNIFKKFRRPQNLNFEARSVKLNFIRYSDFPIYRAPQILINAVSLSLPVFLLSSFFGTSSAGFYAVARMVLGMPSLLIGQSVGDVFYQKINEAFNSAGNHTSLIIKATFYLAILGIVPCLIIFLFGPFLFEFVFGADWSHSGIYAKWLSVFFFFNLINKPSVAAVPVLGIQKGLLIYEVVSTCMKIAAFLLGFFVFSSDVYAVMFFSFSGAFAYFMMISWIIFKSNKLETR